MRRKGGVEESKSICSEFEAPESLYVQTKLTPWSQTLMAVSLGICKQ